MFSKIASYFKKKDHSKQNDSGAGQDAAGDDADDIVIETHYDTLYVTPDASAKVIRMVYIALQKKYHPDANLHNPEATAMAQYINEAYRVLADPQKRAAHDQSIVRQQTPLRQQQSDPQMDKLKAELAAWEDLKVRAENEVKRAKEQVVQTARNAASARPQDKPLLDALAAQAAAAVKSAEEKVAHRTADAESTAAKINARGVQTVSAKVLVTYYATIKVNRFAPIEVIHAAYAALVQEHGASPEIDEAHKILSNPQAKSDYDAVLERQTPTKKSATDQVAKNRAPTAREKEAQEKADKATALVPVMTALAEKMAQDVKELEEKAAEAAQSAKDNAQGPDAKKWADWANKLAEDLASTKKYAQKAVTDAEHAEIRARDAVAAAAFEKKHADKIAAAEADSAEKKRSVRKSAEKAELGVSDTIIVPPSSAKE